jgi:hypothetical protein
MSATFGAASSPFAAPGSSVVNEWSDEHTQQIKTYRDEMGVTVGADPMLMKERKVSVSGIGNPSWGLEAAASISAGTLVITSQSQDDSAEDYPKFKLELVSWS